eukprot:CAMPEP_0115860822 /NCGR_PEP_ID=MMETSP0287-20121206/17328_1 /TAXON_ID=412157 /ORGANISM="Chrysochromulina rotalis, Strain UIO044" /LENGTH=630 /DNA_ID=CAMNT_0003315163 /DNA_START=69 /DNA_END=1961 /DNA_ORIENTATION=+
MNDGPQGFRDNVSPGTTTAWPSGLNIAASFDLDAALEWGEGMGVEFYEKGSNVQLGPGLCLARVPRNGRNFEYMSGEDPYLGNQMVQPVIRGIQSKKVVANAKHWAFNNQETNRDHVSANVDERTRFELYYPPFKGAIDAGVGSVMCSYNKINGTWSCENPATLQGDLKRSLGFNGFVMSDWGATHSASVMAGLDMEMPSANFVNESSLAAKLADGSLTPAGLQDAVHRILRTLFAVGVMDEPLEAWDWKKLKANVTTEASVASARKLAAASTVMLKNDGGLLPLPPTGSIAVIGLAGDAAVTHGGGSGAVVPSYIVKPLNGIKAAAPSAKVTFEAGDDIDAAVKAAEAADVTIVFAGTLSSEGRDRVSLSLDDGCDDDTQCGSAPDKQNALIVAVAAANPRCVVVLSVPGAVLMPWSGSVAALLINFLPGQQAGHAVADILFGAVNPSAKLPLTMPNIENETAFSPAQWPGLPDPAKPEYANYTEGLLVGYRYYDAHAIAFSTGFPFGHGLSYTSFVYSNLRVMGSPKFGNTTVVLELQNTGGVAGAEVAQLYVGFPATAGEPPKVLKGFRKVALEPNETLTVTFALRAEDLSVWSVPKHSWEEVKGEIALFVGASSRDIRLSGKVTNE